MKKSFEYIFLSLILIVFVLKKTVPIMFLNLFFGLFLALVLSRRISTYFLVVFIFQVFLYSFVPYLAQKEGLTISGIDFMLANKSFLVILYYFLVLFLAYMLFHPTSSLKISNKQNNRKSMNKMFKLMLVLFIISLLSLLFYSSFYGGLSKLLRIAAQLRSGFVADNSYLFIYRFITFITYVNLFFFYSLLNDYKKNLSIFLFLFSFLVVVLVSFISASRQVIIAHTVYLMAMSTENKRKQGKTNYFLNIIGIMIVSIIIINGKKFFAYLSYSSQETSFFKNNKIWSIDILKEQIVREFIHVFIAIPVSLKHSRFTKRFLIDFLIGFLNILPKKLLGISLPTTLTTVNTSLIYGSYGSFSPPGILAFSIYGFGFLLGPLLIAMFYVAVQTIIIKNLSMNLKDYPCLIIFKYPFLVFFLQSSMSFDPYVVFKSYFILFFTYILSLTVLKRDKFNV